MGTNLVVLQNGYCKPSKDGKSFTADCTVTLIKSPQAGHILVDTGGPWDKSKLIDNLSNHHVTPADISTVVCTHGHSDHIGNLNIFPITCKIIVGFDISCGNVYEEFDFRSKGTYKLSDDIDVIATPGHMHHDVSVVVRKTELGTVVVVGDLYESEEDLVNESLWKDVSEDPRTQQENRVKIMEIADYIVPGHGPMFDTKKYKTPGQR